MRTTFFIMISILFSSSFATASVGDQLRQCVVALEKSGTLDPEQIEFVIGSDFAEVAFPSGLTRFYRINDKTLIRLEYRKDVSTRRFSIVRETLPDNIYQLLIYQIRDDLASRGIAAVLRPSSLGGMGHAPGPSFTVGTGFRHPLSSAEAAHLFNAIDSILIQRIPGHLSNDAIKFGVLDHSDRSF